jgi:ABC-type Zn2+ transport system substrate-binding protein/surface adhesin
VLRILNVVVVLLLVALVPARAIGSVTLSICASGQEQAGAMHHAEANGHGMHAHDAGHDHHDHHDDPAPGEGGSHACSYCAAHCAGVAFAVPTDLSRVAPAPGSDRIPFGSWSEPGYFPDHLDRPPLFS